MRKVYFMIGLFSISVLFMSCSKDDGPNIDTSKALRSGNFLQDASFENPSLVKVKHSDKFVTEEFKDGEAIFDYAQPESGLKSTKAIGDNYKQQETQLSLNKDVLVEFTPGEYEIIFSYCFQLYNLNPEELEWAMKDAMQDVGITIFYQELNLIDDIQIPTAMQDIYLGSDGTKPMNDKWSTYRTKFKVDRTYYANINFQLVNKSQHNNNKFFIRNIALEKLK